MEEERERRREMLCVKGIMRKSVCMRCFFCIVCVREREEAGGGRVCACACLDFLDLQVIL